MILISQNFFRGNCAAELLFLIIISVISIIIIVIIIVAATVIINMRTLWGIFAANELLGSGVSSVGNLDMIYLFIVDVENLNIFKILASIIC